MKLLSATRSFLTGLLGLGLLALPGRATVTLTLTAGDFGDSLLDQLGNALAAGLDTFLLIDTSGGDFSNFNLNNGTVTWGEGLAGASDIYVADYGASEILFNGAPTVAQFSTTLDLTAYPNLSAGDTFAVLWFTTPDEAATSFNVVAGTAYGLTRESTWVLPADGGTFTSGIEGPAPGGSAAYTTLSAVPEPSTTILLCGLAAFGTAAFLRHRRRVAVA